MKMRRRKDSEKRGEDERRSEKRTIQKTEDQGARKGSKVACKGRKVSSLERRAEPSGEMREMKNYMPLWREAHVELKTCKAHQVLSTLGSRDVRKGHPS